MERNRVLISGLPSVSKISRSDLLVYFQSRKKSGGGEVIDVEYFQDQGEAILTFQNEVAARDVLAKKHHIKGFQIQATVPRSLKRVQSPISDEETSESSSSDDSSDEEKEHPILKERWSILVKNIPSGITKDTIKGYFENSKKKHGGGHVRRVEYKPSSNCAVLSFDNKEDARRMVDFKKHKIKGTRLDVTYIPVLPDEKKDDDDDDDDDDDENDDDDYKKEVEERPDRVNPLCDKSRGSQENSEVPLVFVVSGIASLSSKESLRLYLENTRRSGGGEADLLTFNPEQDLAEVKFESVKDLDKLLHGKHEIDGVEINVSPKAPEEQLPMDPLRIQVKGLTSSLSEDCIRFYIEKMSCVDVQHVQHGGCGNALVSFAESSDVDFEELSLKISKDTRGIGITVERVPLCHCLLVSGLSSKMTKEQLDLYFESPTKGCGVMPSKIELQQGEGKALVYFDDPSVIQKALDKPVHGFQSEQWKVDSFYPFLNEEIPIKTVQKATRENAEIEVDPHVMDHIATHHGIELQNLQDDFHLELEWTPRGSMVKLQEREIEAKECGEWSARVEAVKKIIAQFESKEFYVPPSIWDEVLKNVKETMSSMHQFDKVTIENLDSTSRIRIIAKKDDLQKASVEVETIIDQVNKEKKMQDSVETVVEEDIDSHKLSLLRISDVYKRLQRDRNVKLELNEYHGKLIITGPNKLLTNINMEIFKFFQKIKEEPLELSEGVLEVLQSAKGKELIEKRFREGQIHAVMVYGQRRAKNEASIFCTNKDHGKKAARLVESIITERSFHIEDKTVEVVTNPKWKAFVVGMEEIYKVRISFQSAGQTLWISGIAPDASECYSKVEKYIECNTIFTDFVKLNEGHLRLLFQMCIESIKGIKEGLKDSFVEVEKRAGGLLISGTREGIQEAKEKLMALIANTYEEEIKIEKPGMKKFFQIGQGATLIKVVETEHKCVIEVAEDLPKHEKISTRKTGSASVNTENGECVCSYITKEGKKIAVYKNDLTKHKVDVIVNAANGELQHYAGLAGAIIREGGKDIQDQCNKYVDENGSLFEGHVMESGPGKLPCKRIIHAVGPRWDDNAKKEHKEGKTTKQERLLKFAIANCLKLAENDQVIAIPAVSTGIFRFPVELCASILTDVVTEFFQENPRCKLSEVHFTNHDEATVKSFSTEMKKRFEKESTFSEGGESNLMPKPLHNPQIEFCCNWETSEKNEGMSFFPLGAEKRATTLSHRSHGDDAYSTPEGMKIHVKVGNIAHETADILVNTAGETLDLRANACARAFLEVEGPTLQSKCKEIAPVKPGNIGITRSAGNLNCKYVFHAVCGMWKNKGKSDLQSILKKCFDEANRLGATSIAIPAIGTGVLNFPRNVVAKLSFEEALQFSCKTKGQASLKEVKFVVYEKDVPTVKAFKDENERRRSLNRSPIAKDPFEELISTATRTAKVSSTPYFKKRNDNLYEVNMDNLSVHVHCGDITQESTDAIVVVSNPELEIERGGGAGAAIMRAGGDVVRQECTEHPPISPGSVSTTSAGRLRAKKLIHYVPTDSINEETLSMAVVGCLNAAESQRLSSISFPAIGTGKLGVSPDRCAKAMLKGAISFSKQMPTTVQLIRIVVYQEAMVNDFVSVLKEITGQPKDKEEAKEAGIIRRLGNYLGITTETKKEKEPLKESLQPSKILLQVYCRDLSNLKNAKRAIDELVSKNFIRKDIFNRIIENFEEDQMREIHSIELRFDTRILVEKSVPRIIFEGNSEDVLSSMSAVHTLLERVKDMENERCKVEIMVKNIVWQYFSEAKEVFVPFSKAANASIETAYNNTEKDVTFQENGETLTINFTNNTVKSREGETKVKRKDLRLEENEVLFPTYWATQPKNADGVEETVHLVDLCPNKQMKEYLKVSDLFKNTCKYKILNICRVQNPTQYHNYAVRKQKMEKEKGKGVDVERFLFHGTAHEFCESINKTAFNRNFKGIHATKYGQGTYFAVHAEFSARSVYSPPDSQGKRYMYLARVLVGDYTNGEEAMLVPPPKNPANPTDRYDTVVDDASNPTIFVAFYDWQCYPEYLITFQ